MLLQKWRMQRRRCCMKDSVRQGEAGGGRGRRGGGEADERGSRAADEVTAWRSSEIGAPDGSGCQREETFETQDLAVVLGSSPRVVIRCSNRVRPEGAVWWPTSAAGDSTWDQVKKWCDKHPTEADLSVDQTWTNRGPGAGCGTFRILIRPGKLVQLYIIDCAVFFSYFLSLLE